MSSDAPKLPPRSQTFPVKDSLKPPVPEKSASFTEGFKPEKKEQMAGHAGGLVFFGDGSLAKKTEETEIGFYEESDKFRKMKGAGQPIPSGYGPTLYDFIEFVPKFYGRHTPEVVAEGDKPMIRMEDLAGKFKKAGIVDLKIGAKLYEDGASIKKKIHMATYAAVTSSDTCGVLLCGMQVFDPSTNTFIKFPKKYGYGLNTTTLPLGLRQFFSDSRGRLVHRHNIAPIVERLKRLHQSLSQLPSHRMISGSILLVYEGDPFHRTSAAKPEPFEPTSDAQVPVPQTPDVLVDVRVIDFNHSYFHTEYEGPDTNYLEGLASLIKMLDAVKTMPFNAPPAKGRAKKELDPAKQLIADEWAEWWAHAPQFGLEGHTNEVLNVAVDQWRKWWKKPDAPPS